MEVVFSVVLGTIFMTFLLSAAMLSCFLIPLVFLEMGLRNLWLTTKAALEE